MGFEVITGDCVDVMRGMSPASVDAVVCDPPYEFNFMGKSWDASGVTNRPETWLEVYRLLKDGGRLLAFGGPRTYHRMTCAIEDAGFLIEDCIMWLFGQGFPKHKSKLKPAYEPIVVARKGGASYLNIDACRIGTGGNKGVWPVTDRRVHVTAMNAAVDGSRSKPAVTDNAVGRWPANVILDEEARRALDAQSGVTVSRAGMRGLQGRHDVSSPETARIKTYSNSLRGHDDAGGASRFFYTAKASRAERGEGNNHPTVKPISLMRYLCRLVTPEGGTILDPFCGSGSTGIAAIREGFNFIGIEREAEYVAIAQRRIEHASAAQPPLFSEYVA